MAPVMSPWICGLAPTLKVKNDVQLLFLNHNHAMKLDKSDVSKIWAGQKSGEEANETSLHQSAKDE